MTNYNIYIHNDIEPDTEEWNNLKNYENVYIKKINRNKYFNGIYVPYVQYEADILRLQILFEYGGIYLDTDVYLIKNIDPLLNGSKIYYNSETPDSFINCVLISEPKNELLQILLNNYSLGFKMNIWAWNTKDLPTILFNKYPHYKYKYGLQILDYEHFCYIHWTQGDELNNPDFIITEKMYGVHLCETILGNKLENSYFILNN